MVGIAQGRDLRVIERTLETGNLRTGGELRVGDLVVSSPPFVEHDLTGFPIWDRDEAVMTARHGLDEVLERKWAMLGIEQGVERDIEGRLLHAVDDDPDVSTICLGGPDAPDDTRPLEIRSDGRFAFHALHAAAVIVGIPVDIQIARGIVDGRAIVTRHGTTLLARNRGNRQSLEIVKTMC